MRPLLLAGFIAVAASCLAEPFREVDVNVDMTPEGKKLERPTPDKPQYYFPLFEGYREVGDKVANEKSPTDPMVKALIVKTLAAQGYLADPEAKHGAPQLLIVFYWGYMNPVTIDDPSADMASGGGSVSLNNQQELGLVAGKGMDNLDLGLERSEIMQAANEDRYFIVAQAYDFASARTHKRKLLWDAKMSAASSGINFDQVAATLAKAGGPMMGRETVRPKMIILPLAPQGTVEVGTPEVKDYQDIPLKTDAKPKS